MFLKSFRIEFSDEAARDLGLIFDHLIESYLGFGESLDEALDHSESRIHGVRAEAGRLGTAPHQVSPHEDRLPGFRHMTLNRAIYWFEIHEEGRRIRVLAIIFGGQDHIRRMLLRLTGDPPS